MCLLCVWCVPFVCVGVSFACMWGDGRGRGAFFVVCGSVCLLCDVCACAFFVGCVWVCLLCVWEVCLLCVWEVCLFFCVSFL